MSQNEPPMVCISNFLVSYAPKNKLDKINHRLSGVSKRAIRKYVKFFKITNYPITLTSENVFPTRATELRVLKSVWKNSNTKGNFDGYEVSIKNIEVISRRTIAYEFDNEKD